MSKVLLAVALASGLTPPSARTECFILTGKYVMADKGIDLVFKGKVVAITRTAENGYRATFDVDLVWKGSVPKRIDLYVWELQSERPQFQQDHDYVAVAQRLTDPLARQGVGLDPRDTMAFTPAMCSGALASGIREELGPGRPPQ